ncbi:MAG: peptide deformylase [SAR324 cluster bacterium]|nr:peptide deformylase [SAR324 cluster bacterium]
MMLQVLRFPNPLLRQKSKPVTTFDDDLQRLAAGMLETMYREGGIGLAAPQVGQLKQLIVVDLHAGDEDQATRSPRFYVNPVIRDRSGETMTNEGCLSVPDFTADVTRAQSIKLEYQSTSGDTVREDLHGLAAVCLQHEIDHLRGKLFIDYLPPLKRQMVKQRLVKQARTA